MPALSIADVDPAVKRTARTAGFLYLFMVLTGPFVLMYVPKKLFVMGDATATAANILSHQVLFQWHIAVSVLSNLVFVATVLVLYKLLEPVQKDLARLMAITVIIAAPAGFVSAANEAATLTFLRDPAFLGVFGKAQSQAIAMLFVNYDSAGLLVSELFWGLWLLPLAVLVYRSGFIPRFLGVWLAINGVTYVVLSVLRLAAPGLTNGAFNLMMPLLLGEVAFMLWLVIIGARRRQPARAVTFAT